MQHNWTPIVIVSGALAVVTCCPSLICLWAFGLSRQPYTHHTRLVNGHLYSDSPQRPAEIRLRPEDNPIGIHLKAAPAYVQKRLAFHGHLYADTPEHPGIIHKRPEDDLTNPNYLHYHPLQRH